MEASFLMWICGIDPTSGSKSKLGLAAFNPETLSIRTCGAESDPRNKKNLRLRLQDLAGLTDLWFKTLDVDISAVYMESTVMLGKGGESLARATGALMVVTPRKAEFDFVHNTTVKRIVGGSGKAEKEEVALGLLQYFQYNQKSCETIQDLIQLKDFDQLDALAIAVAGYELSR